MSDVKIVNPYHGNEDAGGRANRRYETGLVVICFLTWGTVFLDRMSLVYLAPFLVKDLSLTHAQIGLLASALALTWAIAIGFRGAL